MSNVKENIIKDKSFNFSVRIVKLGRYLTEKIKRIYHFTANFKKRDFNWGKC